MSAFIHNRSLRPYVGANLFSARNKPFSAGTYECVSVNWSFFSSVVSVQKGVKARMYRNMHARTDDLGTG